MEGMRGDKREGMEFEWIGSDEDGAWMEGMHIALTCTDTRWLTGTPTGRVMSH